MHKLLEVENCVLAYDAEPVVRQVSFSIEAGTIGCLLGPSGCGKTTLLRAIAGFETPQDGKISLRGQVVSHAGWALPPEQRHVGMVFQDFPVPSPARRRKHRFRIAPSIRTRTSCTRRRTA